MQVCGKGGVGVGAGVNGAIVAIVIMGGNDPLDCGELLFQVMSNGLLRLSSKGSGTLVHTGLIQGFACSNHDGDESLLLSLCGSRRGLSHGRGVVLLPLSGDGGLLLINREIGGTARHGQHDGGGWGGGRRWTTMNPRVRSEMTESIEKSMALLSCWRNMWRLKLDDYIAFG
jgi:hypothetical protein